MLQPSVDTRRAFAQLNYVPGRLLETLDKRWRLAGKQTSHYSRRRAKAALPILSPRQLGTCAWALAVMGRTSSPTFRALWTEICGRGLEAMGKGIPQVQSMPICNGSNVKTCVMLDWLFTQVLMYILVHMLQTAISQ